MCLMSLSPKQFQFEHDQWGEDDVVRHEVSAHAQGRRVGHLRWDDSQGDPMISDIKVDPSARRQGVATALYHEARSVEPGLLHHTDVTEAGYHWAKSTGGPTASNTAKIMDENGNLIRRQPW